MCSVNGNSGSKGGDATGATGSCSFNRKCRCNTQIRMIGKMYPDLYVEFKMFHFDNAQVLFNDPDKHNCSIFS